MGIRRQCLCNLHVNGHAMVVYVCIHMHVCMQYLYVTACDTHKDVCALVQWFVFTFLIILIVQY